jgi:hypothetical protein
LLDCEVEVIPMSFQFISYQHQDLPLDAYDEATVSKRLGDPIVDFVNA